MWSTEWLARHRTTVALVATAVGVVLIVWAAFVENDWGQGLLVNMGTAFLLLVPLFLVQQALDRSIQDLRTTLTRSVDGYGAIRTLLPKSDRRTKIMDEYLGVIREAAGNGTLSRSDIELAAAGESTDRTVALAAMTARLDYLDPALVHQSLTRSVNGNEQYWAMSAANLGWDRLPSATQLAILTYLQGDDVAAIRFTQGSDRWRIRQQILARAGVVDPK